MVVYFEKFQNLTNKQTNKQQQQQQQPKKPTGINKQLQQSFRIQDQYTNVSNIPINQQLTGTI